MTPDAGPPPQDAATSCPFGQTACDTHCFNLLNDRDHCGSCTMACHGMMGMMGTCSFGHCVAN